MPTTLSWIISASLLGGLLSVLLAAALTLNTRVSWIQMLVSYAIGALLGATFFNTLPEALELSKIRTNLRHCSIRDFTVFYSGKITIMASLSS